MITEIFRSKNKRCAFISFFSSTFAAQKQNVIKNVGFTIF